MSLWAKRYRHAVCRGLGQAYRLFPHFPLAIKAKAMARQVAQHCSFYATRPGRLMARHRGVFLTALVALSVVPAGHRVLGEAKRRAVDPRCSYWPPGRAPGAARVQEERPLPAAGAASDPTRMTPHESAIWRTGRS